VKGSGELLIRVAAFTRLKETDFMHCRTSCLGVLRTLKSVDVLPEEICKLFLDAAMPEGVKVKPYVICVGKLKVSSFLTPLRMTEGALTSLMSFVWAS
jgi:hypothetical protein